MANVTQKTPNLLGGVSRMADFDKKLGEVREAINSYPDLSYGMTKRPGTQFVGSLGITEAEADQTYFFPIIREGRPRYLCGIRQGTSLADAVKIWNLDTLASITVNSPTGQGSTYQYLNFNTGYGITQNDAYRVASDTKRTVITNRTAVCQENTTLWSSAPNPFTWTTREQNKDNNSIDDLPDGRAVRVNWGNGGNAGFFPSTHTPLTAGTHYLPLSIRPAIVEQGTGNKIKINNQGNGCVLKCQIDSTGVIPYMGGYVNDEYYPSVYATERDPITYPPSTTTTYTKAQVQALGGTTFKYDAEIWSSGSGYRDQCPMQVDGVPGATCTIATGLLPGYVYRVVNSGSNLDDFYMQSFSNTSNIDDIPGQPTSPRARVDGPFFWKECPSPDAYVGLSSASLPIELVDNENNTFTLKLTDYADRWSGDNTNNPAPSFIGKRINNVIFLNNRLGFLCEDSVILSRPINYGPEGTSGSSYVPDDNAWIRRNYTEIDFFRQSAIGMTAADPIDIKVATNDTSVLHKAIPTPQGTLLFSDGQQSLLFQPEGLLSPLTVSINSVSNYDMCDVPPIIIGETCYFINKGSNFCRIYSMVNRGMQNPPVIEDITKEVSDWLPNTLSAMRASLTDNMLLTYTRNDNTVYCRRQVTADTSAWTKWVMPDKIVELILDHDQVVYLTKTDGTVQVHKADMYVVPDDSAYVFAPDVLVDGQFIGIPSAYNYDNKIIGRKQLLPNKYGIIEYFSPSHDYYDIGTENQYGKWLSIDNLGVTGAVSANASAIYSITINTSVIDRWNVGVQIKYKSTTNEAVTFPDEGNFHMMPYDTLFRINYSDQSLSSFIDGCVKTSDCAMLKYMTPAGTEVLTKVWGTEITNISTNETTAVVTLTGCNGGSSTYSIPKSSFHDAYLLNILKNNCSIVPTNYNYARLVIDDSTISLYPIPILNQFGGGYFYGYADPSTYISFSAKYPSYTEVIDRSVFPLRTWWYEFGSDPTNAYISGLAPTVGSWASLGCGASNWGRADEFFCRQNPGYMYNRDLTATSAIEYSSSVNYGYYFSTNGAGASGYFPSRPDINGSQNCTFTAQEDIGLYNNVDGTIGNPWKGSIYVRPVSRDSKDWYAPGYGEGIYSGCSNDDKFRGWGLGGYITYRASRPNVSGDRSVGWAFDGLNAVTPDFSTYWDTVEGDWDWDLVDSEGLSKFNTGMSPPNSNPWTYSDGSALHPSDNMYGEPTQWEDYVDKWGHEPPNELYIRCHFEFTNGTSGDPYATGPQAILTDEVGDGTCDSCPPVLFNPAVTFKDLAINPYLDFYTNSITLQTVVEDNDSTKLRKIIPPTNYPYIDHLQPCLLIAVLPGTQTSGSSDKAGYQVDLTWNNTNDALISPIDLAQYTGKVIIGYRFNYMLELPEFYFRAETTDYTASLTIARIKLALGYSGDCTLQLRSTTNRPHWTQYFSATQANIYEADDGPITEASLHTMPVHQRSNDFYFRITSDSPFPLSVDSVTWEGNYSPRYYRRM